MRAALLALALGATAAQGQDSGFDTRYVQPTDIYGHGALPGGEHAALELRTPDTTHRVRPNGAVFEDTAPRLVDLDGAGPPEVVTVMSDLDRGAMVAVWALADGRLTRVATTAPIGQRHRWLAIAGVADLDGDARAEIAYVDRPHLARVLRVISVWRDAGGWRIAARAQARGHTNHRYGAPDIVGGIVDCGRGPEILTVSADWSRVMATRLDGGGLHTRVVRAHTGPASLRCD